MFFPLYGFTEADSDENYVTSVKHPLPLAKTEYFSIFLGLMSHVIKSAGQLQQEHSKWKWKSLDTMAVDEYQALISMYMKNKVIYIYMKFI